MEFTHRRTLKAINAKGDLESRLRLLLALLVSLFAPFTVAVLAKTLRVFNPLAAQVASERLRFRV